MVTIVTNKSEDFIISSTVSASLVNSSDTNSCTYIEPSVQPDNVSLTFSDDFACPGKTVILICVTYGNSQSWLYNGNVVRFFPEGGDNQLETYEPENEDDFPNITFNISLIRNETYFTSILKVNSEIVVTGTIACKSGSSNNSSSYTYRVLSELCIMAVR